MYVSKAIWPADLRPHYNLSPSILEALGTLDVDPASLVNARTDVIFPPGGPLLAVAAAAAAMCVLLWAAASLLLSSLSSSSSHGSSNYSFLLEPSATLAVAVHWLGFWGPVCGVVQHGMVQMGGDRYAYLPDLALAPVLASALAAMLETTTTPTKLFRGGRRRKAQGLERKVEPSQAPQKWAVVLVGVVRGVAALARRLAVVGAWAALAWPCCRMSASQVLIWRFDEAHFLVSESAINLSHSSSISNRIKTNLKVH